MRAKPMAEGKDIEIRMKATADTAGAQRMEEALEGVNAAAAENPMLEGKAEADARRAAERETAEAIDAQAAALQKAAAAAKEMEERCAELEEQLRDVNDACEEANEQVPDLDENVSKIARAQKAQALAQLAGNIGQIAGKFREAASEAEEFDRAAADSMRATADRIETVTGAVATLALGFATGGPIGLGLAGLVLGAKALMEAFQQAEMASIKAAAAERKAMEDAAEAAREAASAARERASELKSEGIRIAIERENTELEKQLGLIDKTLKLNREKRAAAEEIAKAQDEFNLARITNDEATGKISPEEAAKQRAAIEAGAVGRSRDERVQRGDEAAEAAAKKAEEEEQAARIAAAQVEFAKADEEEARKKAAMELAATAEQAKEVERLQSLVAQEAGKSRLNANAPDFIVDDQPGLRKAIEQQNRADAAQRKLPDEELKLKNSLSKKTSADEELQKREADRITREKEAGEARERAAAAEEAAREAADAAARERDVVAKTSAAKDAAKAMEENTKRTRETQKADEAARRAEEEYFGNQPKLPRETRADLTGAEEAAVGAADNALEGTRGSRFFPPVEKARKALADGGTGEEFAELASELDGFVNALTNIDAKKKANIAAVAKQFRDLAERVKRLENE